MFATVRPPSVEIASFSLRGEAPVEFVVTQRWFSLLVLPPPHYMTNSTARIYGRADPLKSATNGFSSALLVPPRPSSLFTYVIFQSMRLSRMLFQSWAPFVTVRDENGCTGF
jgi:hypothetical protein